MKRILILLFFTLAAAACVRAYNTPPEIRARRQREAYFSSLAARYARSHSGTELTRR